MPQIASLSWISLFIILITTFLIRNSLNYFSCIYENNTTKNTIETNPTNWNW